MQQKYAPIQARRRDIPYYRNSEITQKSPNNFQAESQEVNPFQIAVNAETVGNNNNSGTSSTTQATSNVTLERSRT